MKQSDSIANLAAALVKAQAEVRNAVANSTNPHFKSSYADLEAVKAACFPALAKHGIAVVQSPVVTDSRVGVTTRLLHTSGEWLEGEFTMPSVKQDPQGYGSALTYARRYTLAAFAGVATGDDDDGESAHGRGGKPAARDVDPVESLMPGKSVTLDKVIDRVTQPAAGKPLGVIAFAGDSRKYGIKPEIIPTPDKLQVSATITARESAEGRVWHEVTAIR